MALLDVDLSAKGDTSLDTEAAYVKMSTFVASASIACISIQGWISNSFSVPDLPRILVILLLLFPVFTDSSKPSPSPKFYPDFLDDNFLARVLAGVNHSYRSFDLCCCEERKGFAPLLNASTILRQSCSE